MSRLRLTSHAVSLSSRKPGIGVRQGVGHRLTGSVFGLSEGLCSFLEGVTHAGIDTRHLRNRSHIPGVQEAIDTLVSAGLLVDSSHGPLEPFLDHVVEPVRLNPAVSWRNRSGQRVLCRLRDTRLCRLPRPSHAPTIVTEIMPEAAARCLELADGSRTLREVLSGSSVGSAGSETATLRALDWLTDPDRQLIRLRDPASDRVAYAPHDLLMQSFVTDSSHRDAGAFYRSGIDQASWNFDWVEPTICHAFRFPSSALGGVTYGERFLQAVRERHRELGDPRPPRSILEVGGGTGSFAAGILSAAGAEWATAPRYTIVDLSPRLLEQQAGHLRHLGDAVRCLPGDAESFVLPGSRFDLVISNEMIADLSVSAVRRFRNAGPESSVVEHWCGEGAPWISELDLSMTGAPDRCLLNSGAFRFLDRIWQHLTPGGTAFVTEYGGPATFATRVEHLNHPEYSIHFGHLERAARAKGFDARTRGLGSFLEVREDEPMLTGESEKLLLLRRVLAQKGHELPFAVFSRGDFEAKYGASVERLRMTGISFEPLSWGYHFGPRFSQFHVLELRRPE